MRYCHNDNPRVYEGIGNDLAVLLRDAADQIDSAQGYSAVTSTLDMDGNYIVTLYQH